MEDQEDLSLPSPSKRVPVVPPECSEDEPPPPGTPCSVESDADGEVDSHGGLCPFSRKTVLTLSTLSICCVAFLIFFRTHLFQFLNWLQEAPIWETLVVFVILFTVMAFPIALGYLVLNVAAGYLYGFWWGILVVMVSVLIGFSIAFHVCRLFFRDWVMDYVRPSKVATALVRIVEGDKGFKVIALARLTPVPFGIQNAIFSVSQVPMYSPFMVKDYKHNLVLIISLLCTSLQATNISYLLCLSATMVGLLPTQCLNTYMGSTLRDMTQVLTNGADGYLLLIVQVSQRSCSDCMMSRL